MEKKIEPYVVRADPQITVGDKVRFRTFVGRIDEGVVESIHRNMVVIRTENGVLWNVNVKNVRKL